jgi:HK97 family phage prohead protease
MLELERKVIGGSAPIYPGLDLQWKIVDEDQGIIRGYLAVFNNIDSTKDRIRAGAFKKTLTEALQRKTNRGKKYLFPLLWMHDPEKPIGGFIDAIEDKYGLLVTAQLDISTNPLGMPNNPLATSVYSGFKQGFIDELSIGYKALQKQYDHNGIRDLTEVQLFEGSAVTMLFAANDLAQVTDVKVASGGSFPLADKSTPWSKSKAIKDIEAATGGDWSKASKYFFWSASNPTTEADHKLPFAAKVGGTMKAVPHAIISAAGVMQGAMGGVKGIDDAEGVKSKIAGYYRKMGMSPPWQKNTSTEKTGQRHMEQKDFNDRYREERIKDWMYSDFQNLVCALQKSIIDMFKIGDEPQSDVLSTILSSSDENSIGFVQAVENYVQMGIDLDVSSYLSENGSSYGMSYMSRQDDLEEKAGRTISKTTAQRIQSSMDTLDAVANNHMISYKAITSARDDLAQIIGYDSYAEEGPAGGDATGPYMNTSKSSPEPQEQKALNEQPPMGTEEEVFRALLLSRMTQQ